MKEEDGGQTPGERQRATAAEIARRKVLEAYAKKPGNYAAPEGSVENTYARPEAGAVPVVKSEDWKKYHSAWQDYYKKYYGKYYGQAAKDYVEKEKLRLERAQAEKPAVVAEEEQGGGGVKGVREEIRKKASGQAKKAKRKKHLVSIFVAVAVVAAALFVQYYRVIVAAAVAYVAPGNGEVNSITEIDPTVNAVVGPEPRLIIPKINIDVPVAFGIGADQASQQAAMANGVAQFAIPGANAMPGEVGNLAISGHSSNGVFETGEYKFIFAPLERLADGDTIYINYQSRRYTYVVTGRKVVEPTDVRALIYETNKPMLTLITCTPLGTARQRLFIIAEQISPDPAGAGEGSGSGGSTSTTEPEEMPGNSPTFFEGIWNFLTGQ